MQAIKFPDVDKNIIHFQIFHILTQHLSAFDFKIFIMSCDHLHDDVSLDKNLNYYNKYTMCVFFCNSQSNCLKSMKACVSHIMHVSSAWTKSKVHIFTVESKLPFSASPHHPSYILTKRCTHVYRFPPPSPNHRRQVKGIAHTSAKNIIDNSDKVTKINKNSFS